MRLMPLRGCDAHALRLTEQELLQLGLVALDGPLRCHGREEDDDLFLQKVEGVGTERA